MLFCRARCHVTCETIKAKYLIDSKQIWLNIYETIIVFHLTKYTHENDFLSVLPYMECI